MAAARKMGFGDKEAVDQAAVDAMRHVLGSVSMTGVVVIGEGEKDSAPMLYNGEEIGDGSLPEVDIAVGPVDGTTLTAKSMPSAISVVATFGPRHHVRPGSLCLHGRAGGRPGGGRRGRLRGS